MLHYLFTDSLLVEMEILNVQEAYILPCINMKAHPEKQSSFYETAPYILHQQGSTIEWAWMLTQHRHDEV